MKNVLWGEIEEQDPISTQKAFILSQSNKTKAWKAPSRRKNRIKEAKKIFY